MRPSVRIQKLLDERLSKRPLSTTPLTLGWVKTIRFATGINVMQLATRLDITHQAISKFEQAEVDGTITLASLQKIAAAFDCDLSYSFVPRAGSIKTLSEEREGQWDLRPEEKLPPSRRRRARGKLRK